MSAIVRLLSRVVLAAPAVVVVVALLLTAGLGVVSGQAQFATGNEGFAPDDPELLAAETIAERFRGNGEAVLQVLVEGELAVREGVEVLTVSGPTRF
jgi:uncharacterized protein